MNRVYKSAMSCEVARGIILDLSGKQFDPLVVDAFLAIEPEFISIKQEYLDN